MYRAIINMNIEVHKVNDKNECSGMIVPTNELSGYGLANCMLLAIDGQTKNDCLTKLSELLKDIKRA